MTTGRNNVDIAHGQTEKKAADASSQPQVALDVSSLGGMYAGKIRLVGTETGVGVRNAGHIGAQAGAVKGPGKAVKQVIPFEGNEKSFETILKQLNR
ncbi:hypothetical protein QSE66_004687 [Escherichia coli]|nr:hypothetical protein [Escherichia coli]ELR4087793.1 hypothetical protein [Escherichia coli]